MSFGMIWRYKMKNWNFKLIFKEIAIALVILFVVSNALSYIRKPNLDSDKLPQIEATLLSAEKFIYDKNKPLVIHFWATWCPTCKLEAQNIEFISKRYQVLTIAVNSGDDNKIKEYLKERDLSFDVINDKDSNLAEKFKVVAYPTTFIYNGNGDLKFSEVGYSTTVGLLTRLEML